MPDETLTKYLKTLEAQIGKDRVRALRSAALARGTTLEKILAEAANKYAAAFLKSEEAA